MTVAPLRLESCNTRKYWWRLTESKFLTLKSSDCNKLLDLTLVSVSLYRLLVEFYQNFNANAVIWMAEPLHTISHWCAVVGCCLQNGDVFFLFFQAFWRKIYANGWFNSREDWTRDIYEFLTWNCWKKSMRVHTTLVLNDNSIRTISFWKFALHPIFTKFGQWEDLIISKLQAIFQLFLSYPLYPCMRILSSWGIKYSTEVMAALPGGMFIW